MTLAELKTLIQNFCESTETTFTNTLNDIIISAEDRILREVQLNVFRKNVTGNLTTGNRFLSAPSDYILTFSLAAIDSNGDYKFLQKKHPTFINDYIEDTTDATLRGLPKYYADFDAGYQSSENDSTITVAPVPDSDYNVELHYFYKPQSLTSATDGTWLSNNARNALLYGSLFEAYTFLKGEPDLLKLYNDRYLEELSRLKNEAEARGTKDEYRYDRLRTQTT